MRERTLIENDVCTIRYAPTASEERVQPAPRIEEKDLSEDQREVFDALCGWIEDDRRSDVLTLGGYAGTGKSTLLSLLGNRYDDLRIAYCAFTGKATNVLRTKLRSWGVVHDGFHTNISTIHSLIYEPVMDRNTGEIVDWNRRLELDCDVIIVDEASMIDEEIFNDLAQYGKPILAVGDHGQLPPINGNFNLMNDPELRLEHIHRQAAQSPILALSEYVRTNGKLPAVYEDPRQEVQIVSKKAMPEVVAYLLGDLRLNPLEMGLLSFTNRTRVDLNARARSVVFSSGTLPFPLERSAPRKRDVVILLRNYARTIFNGMRGVITDITDSTAHLYRGHVRFPDDSLEVTGYLCKSQFNRASTYKNFDDYEEVTGYRPFKWAELGLLFDFGYALTVHKSQGSEFKYVALVDDAPMEVDPEVYKRFLYTAITRCSSHLIILR